MEKQPPEPLRPTASNFRSLAFLLLTVSAVNLGLTWVVGRKVLLDFPRSADEYAYRLSAELFATGRTHAPSPEPRASFNLTHVVNDGKYYGKYPPGFPAVAALLSRGIPWEWVNGVLGVLTLVLLGLLGRRFAPSVVAYAILLSLACPFFVFHSATFYSHPACACALLGAAYGLCSLREDPFRVRWAILAGACLGAALLIRPATTTAVGVALAWGLLRGDSLTDRSRAVSSFLKWGIPVLLPFVVLNGWYNQQMTGNFLTPPFLHYQSSDHPSWLTGDGVWLLERLRTHGWLRFLSLVSWTGGLPLVAIGALIPGRDRVRGAVVWVAPLLALGLMHLFYWGRGGFQYGPRFLYEAWPFLLIAGAYGVKRCGRLAPLVLACVVGFNLLKLHQACAFHGPQVKEYVDQMELIKKSAPPHSLVLFGTGIGSLPPSDLIRNGTSFGGSILLAVDRGPRSNRALTELHPDRKVFYYVFDPDSRRGRLESWDDKNMATDHLRRYAAEARAKSRLEKGNCD